jgi:hypothetical protein
MRLLPPGPPMMFGHCRLGFIEQQHSKCNLTASTWRSAATAQSVRIKLTNIGLFLFTAKFPLGSLAETLIIKVPVY